MRGEKTPRLNTDTQTRWDAIEGAILPEKSFRPYVSQGTGGGRPGQKESASRRNCSSSRDKELMQFRVYCFCRCRRRTHVVRFGIYRLISSAIALATVGEIVAAGIATCSLKYCKHRENDDTLMEAGESSISYVFQSRRYFRKYIESFDAYKSRKRYLSND